MKNEIIKDVFDRKVKVGDKVAVLTKIYSFMCLYNATLDIATYLGKGQYGYVFKGKNGEFNIRKPQVVLK